MTVLTLDDGASEYRVAGTYRRGDEAASLLLEGFRASVAEVFSQQ